MAEKLSKFVDGGFRAAPASQELAQGDLVPARGYGPGSSLAAPSGLWGGRRKVSAAEDIVEASASILMRGA